MRRELSAAEEERLFTGAVDGVLSDEDTAVLDERPEVKAKYAAYERVVKLLRDEPREKAPDGLATLILARTKRRRFALRQRDQSLLSALPAEVLIPLLIAAAVAAFMLLASP